MSCVCVCVCGHVRRVKLKAAGADEILGDLGEALFGLVHEKLGPVRQLGVNLCAPAAHPPTHVCIRNMWVCGQRTPSRPLPTYACVGTAVDTMNASVCSGIHTHAL
jgi:hypothetical protein